VQVGALACLESRKGPVEAEGMEQGWKNRWIISVQKGKVGEDMEEKDV
jgi:hypothetical protein